MQHRWKLLLTAKNFPSSPDVSLAGCCWSEMVKSKEQEMHALYKKEGTRIREFGRLISQATFVMPRMLNGKETFQHDLQTVLLYPCCTALQK